MTTVDARAAEAAPDALFGVTPDGRVAHWNRAAELLFGYPRDEAIGRAVEGLIVPAAQGGEARAMREEAAQGNGRSRETVRRCKDGSLVYVYAMVQALRDEAGGLLGYVESNVDVTHLKVERDAHLIESRYGDLLESTPDAIVMVNEIGRIVLVNGQAEAMFGYAREELLSRPLEILMPARYRSSHVRHRAAYLAQSRTRPMGQGLELHGVRKNGEEFPVEISLSPLQTEVGRVGMSAIRDISDRRRFERALQEKNVELERANQAKDRFLATMSHELRTPLNAIIGFTGLMLMKLPGPLTADQEKQLGMVQSSAKHLLSLINDLLDVAKIDSGNVLVQLAAVPVQPLVEEVASTLRPSAEGKGLRLELRLPAQPLVIRTDRRALQQILINLASNAIKFTDGGKVSIALRSLQHEGRLVHELSVIDTGIGIAEPDQARLFQPFSQVGSHAARRSEGTGLGLYLCSKLAALLGGRIALHSEPGKGSCFTLTLPGDSAP